MAGKVFAMAGGGTGGHVMPAIAVARELLARGHEVFFVGTRRGLEARLAPQAGFELEWIEIGGLQRTGFARQLRTALELPFSVVNAARILRRRRAQAVFSLGGYVAGPVVIAALLLGIPLVAMEPNAIPGLVHRRIANRVFRALVGFPQEVDYFPPQRTEVTGVPVRPEFFELPEKKEEEKLTVLITGGSQGSKTLNNAFRESWPKFAGAKLPVRFLHQAGPAMAEELAEGFHAVALDGEVTAFITDMPAAFAQADLVVGRSGANAIAELAAAGKPSILVPFPFAADDHQRKNAEAMEKAGAARLIPDGEMTGPRLFAEVAAMARDRAALRAMGEAARRLSRPVAARRAADALEEAAGLTTTLKAETIRDKNVF